MPLFYLDNFVVNTKTAASADSPITTHPITQLRVPEDLHLQQHSYESLTSCIMNSVLPTPYD